MSVDYTKVERLILKAFRKINFEKMTRFKLRKAIWSRLKLDHQAMEASEEDKSKFNRKLRELMFKEKIALRYKTEEEMLSNLESSKKRSRDDSSFQKNKKQRN